MEDRSAPAFNKGILLGRVRRGSGQIGALASEHVGGGFALELLRPVAVISVDFAAGLVLELLYFY